MSKKRFSKRRRGHKKPSSTIKISRGGVRL